MRRVTLPGLNIRASCIGFGCASLGSRVSKRTGLESLTRAYEAGVTWFDLAPAYGAGEAETIFATFLQSRRAGVQVLTKVGLAAPARSSLLRAAHTILRPFAGAVTSVRRTTRSLPVGRNRGVPIAPAQIADSIERSLRRLGTDYVEVLALHDPAPDIVLREDVVRALERVVARGQARAVGIAGSLDACLAGTAPGLPYRLFQTSTDPAGEALAAIRGRSTRPVTTIGHSVVRSAEVGADLARLVQSTLAGNRDGVTLLSMFSSSHLAANLVAERDAAAAIAAPQPGEPSLEAAS